MSQSRGGWGLTSMAGSPDLLLLLWRRGSSSCSWWSPSPPGPEGLLLSSWCDGRLRAAAGFERRSGQSERAGATQRPEREGWSGRSERAGARGPEREGWSGAAAGARGLERRSGRDSGQSGSGRGLGQRRAHLSGGDGFERRRLGLGRRRARGKWGEEEENSRPAEALFG
jgi:hypothetical protein